MVEAGKTLDLVPSAIARHATAKRRQRQMLRDLRKHQFAQVHGGTLRVSSSQDRKSSATVSNRAKKHHELSIQIKQLQFSDCSMFRTVLASHEN